MYIHLVLILIFVALTEKPSLEPSRANATGRPGVGNRLREEGVQLVVLNECSTVQAETLVQQRQLLLQEEEAKKVPIVRVAQFSLTADLPLQGGHLTGVSL